MNNSKLTPKVQKNLMLALVIIWSLCTVAWIVCIVLDIVKDDEFANVTFSGGDPLYQVEAFTELARRIKEETGKTIWCYTGFTYEEVLADERLSQILPFIDTLVEGPFVLELRDTNLPFRGSSNQRIIHLR